MVTLFTPTCTSPTLMRSPLKKNTVHLSLKIANAVGWVEER
ncbi:MAG: hypothetical protein AAF757_17190 [Cyanobacteria bacterium P01_D01_bin.116]